MSIIDKLPLINSTNKKTRIIGYAVYGFAILAILGSILPEVPISPAEGKALSETLEPIALQYSGVLDAKIIFDEEISLIGIDYDPNPAAYDQNDLTALSVASELSEVPVSPIEMQAVIYGISTYLGAISLTDKRLGDLMLYVTPTNDPNDTTNMYFYNCKREDIRPGFDMTDQTEMGELIKKVLITRHQPPK